MYIKSVDFFLLPCCYNLLTPFIKLKTHINNFLKEDRLIYEWLSLSLMIIFGLYKLECTARDAGLLLTPAEGFGLQQRLFSPFAKKILFSLSNPSHFRPFRFHL